MWQYFLFFLLFLPMGHQLLMVTNVSGTSWSCRGGLDLPAGEAGNGLPESSLESTKSTLSQHWPLDCIWQFGVNLNCLYQIISVFFMLGAHKTLV